MSEESQQQPEAQNPMEKGKQNAQQLITEAMESDFDEPPAQVALQTAIEHYQQAQKQSQRAQNIKQASMMTVKILETVAELDSDGILGDMSEDGSVLEEVQETQGIDSEAGAVVEGIETDD